MRKTTLTSFYFLLVLLTFIHFNGIYSHGTAGETNIKQDTPPSTQNDGPGTPPPAAKREMVMVDPGHGGSDSGVSKGDVVESEVTLDISKLLKGYLEKNNYNVEMTRSADISLFQLSKLTGVTQQKRELDARTNIINSSGADLFVSIHVNSYPQYPGMSGSIVYYNSGLPGSRELAGCIQKRMNSISVPGFTRDTHDTQEADFYLLKNCNITGVLVETAFITNAEEYKLLQQEDYRSELAKAVADGISDYKSYN